MIDKAFLKFDKDGSGSINSNDLKGVYNCSFHPGVKAGKTTQDAVYNEFLKSFGDKNGDGTIERVEWNDYYAAVSASIDNDDHFVELMRACWKLD
jgi:calcyphosin